MKLYDSLGPNPRTVRMFLAEKGVEIPREEVDIRKGENREGPFLAKNPTGTCPALELDDGTVLSEVTAICEFVEENHPSPALIGTTPEERAEARMWTRRIDLGICEPLTAGFRYGKGLKMFQNRMRCIPHAADDLTACALDKVHWLDGQMQGRTWIAGERLTLADVLLFAFLDFGAQVGVEIPEEDANVRTWYERMKARPSAAA